MLSNKQFFRRFLSYVVTVATVVATFMATDAGMTKVQAANDEIMLGAFWTSDADTTDTLYWSTDGINFYELCEAYTDASPADPNTSWIRNWAYEQGIYPTNFNVSTLHDPGIIYKDGYFMMISGYADGTGDAREFRPMIGYSQDLKKWSFPRFSPVRLSSKPVGGEKYGANWDMVAPDFMVDDDGTIYIVASFGYYASWHGDDPTNDIMQPYLVKGRLNIPEGVDVYGNPDKPLDASYEQAIPINLPCMTERASVANDHIDGSLYKEGSYYYFSVKENGVTIEIYRTRDLNRASDPSVWELVSYDVASGYEGPSMTKYQGQYFMYMDRLETYTPVDAAAPYGSTGIWVVKASTGTTGTLDQYTGWLDSNIKQVKTYDLNGNIRPNRHGSVITLTGQAAEKVRQLASETRYGDTSNKYNNSEWNHDGWFYQESYRDWRLGGNIIKYLYKNDVRLGVDPSDSEYFGVEVKDPEGRWVFLEGSKMGKMATASNIYSSSGAVITDAYRNGDYQVYMPYDMDKYNSVGPDAYGNEPDTWCWKRYDYYGNRSESSSPWIVDGKTGANYHYDENGCATIGRFDYKNADGYIVTCYMDPSTGKRVENQTLNFNGKDYYFDLYGSFIAGRSSSGATVNDIPRIPFRSPDTTGAKEKTKAPSSNPNWQVIGDKIYWNEDGVRQGTQGRGKEIYDPDSDAWYWLDAIQDGAVATSKDVYQESLAGKWGDSTNAAGEKIGKWVRYDEKGHMIKGWSADGKYYFDPVYGTMAKGNAVIDGKAYFFNLATGVLEGEGTAEGSVENGWLYVGGKAYWYESGVRQGYDPGNKDYRGKEIYDPESDAWYWLDNVQEGAKAVSKDVYQESLAGVWGDSTNAAGEKIGKWVRYDEKGHMIKGWSADGRYYFDLVYGTMAKGEAVIDGVTYYFDPATGIKQ